MPDNIIIDELEDICNELNEVRELIKTVDLGSYKLENEIYIKYLYHGSWSHIKIRISKVILYINNTSYDPTFEIYGNVIRTENMGSQKFHINDSVKFTGNVRRYGVSTGFENHVSLFNGDEFITSDFRPLESYDGVMISNSLKQLVDRSVLDLKNKYGAYYDEYYHKYDYHIIYAKYKVEITENDINVMRDPRVPIPDDMEFISYSEKEVKDYIEDKVMN